MSANPETGAQTEPKKIAQGIERSDDALGHESQNTSSIEAVEESGVLALTEIVQPRRAKASPADHPDLHYIGLEHIEAHTTRLLGSVPATEMRSTANRFQSGDVLYSRLRPYLNKVWRADREGLCSSEFIVLPGNERIDPAYLCYRLNAHDFVSFANSLNAGDRPRVDFDQISTFQTWLPNTLTEQRRIVAEIEKQFTRLEAGVAALRRVGANLKRYRAAVLKAACEGQLLRDTVDGQLPASWRRAELGNVVSFAQGIQVGLPDQVDTPADGYVRFLRITNYTQNDSTFTYVRDPGAKYFVDEYEVVMVRYGTPGFVGRGLRGVIANNLFRVIPGDCLHKDYLFYHLKSKAVTDLIRSRQKGGTMQAISFGQLKDIPINVPPLAEQTQIVAEVERRLSVVEESEALVSTNLHRATRLRQSILQKAFVGAL